MKTKRESFSECEREKSALSDEEATFFIQHLHVLAPLFIECIYVLDIPKKKICYVKPDNLFLCGFSVEDALRDGYDFYSKIVYTEDLFLWTDMRRAVLRYLNDFEAKRNEIDYFSCMFRLQYYSPISHSRSSVQMICHRMEPVWVGDKLRYLICSVRTSTIRKAGHLCVYGKDGRTCEIYRFATKCWDQNTKISLTENEKKILKLAGEGKNYKEIANVLCKSENTISNQVTSIFFKLDVHSMAEAIDFERHYRLVYPPP